MEVFSIWAPCWAQRLLHGTIWVIWHTSAGLGTTSSCLMNFADFAAFADFADYFADFADFAECLWHQSFQQFQLLCLWQWPTLGANIVFFANSFAATSSTNTRTQLLNFFIQIYYNNSHQHHENVTIEVSHSSMFKNHSR